MTELQRAAGYVRISALMGREQGNDLLSDEIQKDKIEAWANYRGFRVVEWYIDLDVSGREGVRRPQFERMMADARDHRFDAVAVYRLTRFARSVKQAAAAYSELRKLDVALVSVTEDIDTSTASGSFMQNILFAMAEFESERISEEWRNVHANRRRRGIAHVSRPILGYRIAGAEIESIEEAEAAAVRLMYEERLRGAGYGEIRGALWRHGFRPKGGGEYFPASSIKDVLVNPLYAGVVRLGDELIDGRHDAIVPRDKWDAVQTMHQRVATTRRFTGSLLSGLLVCSGCGYRMRYETRSNRPAVYRCAHSGDHRCLLRSTIKADAADEYVQERFLDRFDTRRMPNRGKAKRTRQQSEWQRKAGRARARVAELERALDAIADQRFVKGTLEAAEYQRQFDRFASEREQREREAAEYELMARQIRPIEADVLARWPVYPVEIRRRALRMAIDKVTVLPAPSQGGRLDRGVQAGKRLQIGWVS